MINVTFQNEYTYYVDVEKSSVGPFDYPLKRRAQLMMIPTAHLMG